MTEDAYRTLCEQARSRGYRVLLHLDPHGKGVDGELTYLEVRDGGDLLARVRLVKDDSLERAGWAVLHDLHATGQLPG